MAWPENPTETIFLNLRLKGALLKFPDIRLTSNQEVLQHHVERAARNFQATGHFLCPVDPLKLSFESPHLVGEHECPCWKAIKEARTEGISVCGLLETTQNFVDPPTAVVIDLPFIKEKLRALRDIKPKPTE